MKSDIPYRYAAITGASSGIGRAIALKMAKENISVALLARRKKNLEQVAAEINKINPKVNVLAIQGDVRDKDSVEAFVKKCRGSLGGMDIFFNNAGIAFEEPFTRLSPEQVQDLVATNFTGSVWSIYHAMQWFEEKQRGVLVNISSTTVLKPFSKVPLYAATKLGISGLIRAIEEEHLENQNLKIINIIPGPTLTDLIPGRNIRKGDEPSLISPDDIAHWAWLAINSPKNCKVSSLVLRNSGKF
jgi:NADP-dependent 3-hydroxy acid dehydrogenase YdfG